MPQNDPIIELVAGIQSPTLVEIGVAQGEGAWQFLDECGVNQYVGIDPWKRYEQPPDNEFDEGYLDRKMGMWDSQDDFDTAKQRPLNKLEPFEDKVQIIQDYSHNAVDDVPDGIDVLHIDGKPSI